MKLTPKQPKQKFKRGDKVHIGKMPSWMSHFEHDCDALILYSYEEKFRMGHTTDYAVLLIDNPNRNDRYSFTAWYEEHQLTKIGRGSPKELKMCLKRAIES